MSGVAHRGVMLFLLLNSLIILLALAFGSVLPTRSQVIYEAQSPRRSDLYILDVERGLSHNLTAYDGQQVVNTRAQWSPDGRYLIFEVRRDRESRIYLLEADSGRTYLLAPDLTTNQYRPGWTQDGRKVQFLALSRMEPMIYEVDMQTRIVAPAPGATAIPTMDLPEQFMVMTYRDGRWGISVYDGDWSNLRHLTNNDVRFREPPRVSNDTTQIAFISGSRGDIQIYVMDANGENFRRVTADSFYKTNLRWRP